MLTVDTWKEQTTTNVSSFVIKELTGEQRELTLSGRALPYRPLLLEGDQRAEVTWYAGSPVATAQMLGADEKETTITGAWKDRYLSDDVIPAMAAFVPSDSPSTSSVAEVDFRALTTARQIAELVDSMRRQGQLVEVQWMHLKRRGFIKTFKQGWQDIHTVEWELTFGWISQADEDAMTVVTRQTDLNDISQRTGSMFDDFMKAITTPLTLPVVGEWADQVNRSASALANAANKVEDAVRQTVDNVCGPADAARYMMSTLRGIESDAEDIIGYSTTRVARSIYQVKDAAVDLVEIPVSAVVSAGRAMVNLCRSARRNKHAACRNRLEVTKSLDPELIATHWSRSGEDLRDVARVYYGTSDEWQSLRRFNGLRTSQLTAGQRVLVPRRGGSFGGA